MNSSAMKKQAKKAFSPRMLSRLPSFKKKSPSVTAALGKVLDEGTNDVNKEGEAKKQPDEPKKKAPAAAGVASGDPSDRSASKPGVLAPTLTTGETIASKESSPAAVAAAAGSTPPPADRPPRRLSSNGGLRRWSSLLTLMGSSQNISGRKSVPTPSSLQRLVENAEWDELRDILVNTPDEPPPPPKRKAKRASTFGRRRSSMSSFSDEEDEDQEGQDGVRRPYVDLPKLIEECTDFTGQTILHDVLRCHPPLDVVTLLVELYPRSLLDVDCMGHSLLHVAAGWGASPQIVEYLSDLNGRMAGKGDCRGKTPLHLMCENLVCSSDSSNSPNAGETKKKAMNGKSWRESHYRIGLRDVLRSDTGGEQVTAEGESKKDVDNDNLVEGPTLGAISALLAIRPSAVFSRDRDGMTPIDYARRGNAPREVLELLRREAARYRADDGSDTVDELSWSESDNDCNDKRDGRHRRANRRISSRRISNRDADINESGFAERLAEFMGTSVDDVKAELATDADVRRRKSERSRRRGSMSDIPREIEVPLDLTLTRAEGGGKDDEASLLSVGDDRTEKDVRKGPLPFLPGSNGVEANESEGDDRGNFDDGSDDASPMQNESHITAEAEHLTLSNEGGLALKEALQ